MKAFRCRNKQCKAVLAFVNGQQSIKCERCGKEQRVYSESKGIRFKLAAK